MIKTYRNVGMIKVAYDPTVEPHARVYLFPENGKFLEPLRSWVDRLIPDVPFDSGSGDPFQPVEVKLEDAASMKRYLRRTVFLNEGIGFEIDKELLDPVSPMASLVRKTYVSGLRWRLIACGQMSALGELKTKKNKDPRERGFPPHVPSD